MVAVNAVEFLSVVLLLVARVGVVVLATAVSRSGVSTVIVVGHMFLPSQLLLFCSLLL